MKSRRREGPSTFLTVIFSFCTALILFAILRSIISDPAEKEVAAQKTIEVAKPIVLAQGQVNELPKQLGPKPLETVPQPSPAPLAPSPSPYKGEIVAEQKHTVKERETLSSISKKYYGTETKWELIWEANKGIIPNKNRIRPGLTLVIPDQTIASS